MSGPANPINTPLWFIRDLMVLVLLSPIIWWLIKKTKMTIVITLGIVWFFLLGQYIGFPGLCHQSLFFFPLGAYFGINRLNFVEMARKCTWMPFIYFVLAFTDALLTNEPYKHFVHNSEILLGMITFVFLASSLLEKEKIHVNTFLAGASFFVYALHNLFLGKVTKLFVICVRPESPILVLLIYFVMPAMAILLCLGLYKLIYQRFPHFASALTGGR